MQFKAVIVAEKPGVARAFATYLAEGRYSVNSVAGVGVYTFKYEGGLWASVGVKGHLMNFDFPPEYNDWKAVDPRALFDLQPARVLREGMRKYVAALRQLASATDTAILALDADVEGEAIAYEVMDVMRRVNPQLRFLRAWFSAVTREDLVNAIRNPRSPNPLLANKAFSRMVLDLTIGAAFTRTLTLIVEKRNGGLPRGKFLSYGPCQTPVLYLVVKRAIEREKFQKKKFYQVAAMVRAGGAVLRVKHERKFERRGEAEALVASLRRAARGVVASASYVEKVVEPPEPLATVEMERRASRFLNIRSKRAMEIAEDLYQEGLISYPRTDTTIYPPTINLRAIASLFARHEELSDYVREVILSQPKLRVRQGSEDDRAHPPIYPLKCASRAEVVRRFGEDGWKLYDLIVRHFLATLSPPMRVEEQRVEVEVGGVRLAVEGLRVVELGYTRVYPFERPSESALPRLSKGDKVEVVEAKAVEGETKPPPYLSESELLRLMKRYGIGTDATMQDHIHTNIERRYFAIVRRQCIPTSLGWAVIEVLSKVSPEVVAPEVRGEMERMLQEIARGARKPVEVVEEVKQRFREYLKRVWEAEEEVAQPLLKAVAAVYAEPRGDSSSRRSRVAAGGA